MYDSEVRMLSADARELEIQRSRSKVMELRGAIESAPLGVDTSELRRQMYSAMGKSGRHARAFDGMTPTELGEAIAKYFDERQALVTDENGEVIGTRQLEPVTMSGLANFLGVDRKTLVNYSRNESEYSPVIIAARNKIEELYESRLVYGDKPVGTIFALKNMGWSDTAALTIQAEGERRLSAEEIERSIEEDII